jgi:hypothetical protein
MSHCLILVQYHKSENKRRRRRRRRRRGGRRVVIACGFYKFCEQTKTHPWSKMKGG